MKFRAILMTTVATGLVMTATPSFAQDAEGDSPSDIVVTARKREESILKVPIAVTVLGNEQLRQYATGDLQRVADQVPSLVIGSHVAGAGAQVSLRGVGTATFSAAIDQSVSLNIDGMQMTQGLAYASGLFDMEQVTVLKGPQALFYGKASPGGVISIKSADPKDHFEAGALAGYEIEAREKAAELFLSGPLGDTFRVRLAGKYSDSDGYFRNRGIPQLTVPILASPVAPPTFVNYPTGAAAPISSRMPKNEMYLLRGTVIWDPSSSFTAKLKLNYGHTDTQGTGAEGQYASCPDGTAAILASSSGPVTSPVSFIGGDDCKLDRNARIVTMDPTYFPGLGNGGVPFNKSEQYFGSLDLNYDLGNGLGLSSVTGYYHVDQAQFVNGTETTAAAPLLVVDTSLARKDFTQELRLTSDWSDRPINFMVGGFYQKSKMDYDLELIGNQAYTPRVLFGIPAFVPAVGPYAAINTPVLPPRLLSGFHHIDIESWSGFAQVLWKVVPELEIGLGARYTDEKRTLTQTNRLNNYLALYYGAPVVPNPVVTTFPTLKSSNWSPELSVTYTPTQDLTVYFNLKQAYKSGSFDVAAVHAPTANPSFRDERTRGGELGMKGRLLDGQMAFNLSGYYYNFKNLQVGANEVIYLPGTDGVIGTGDDVTTYAQKTLNAASSKVYGVDFDLTYAPRAIAGLTLRGAVNWNHARYGKFNNALCWGGQTVAEGCNLDRDITGLYKAQDLSGKSLLRAPDWAASFGFDYELPLANSSKIRFGSNTTYSSSYFSNILHRSDMKQGAFAKTSANITFVGPGDNWEFSLIGDNLTDKVVATNCINANFQVSNAPNTIITGGTTKGTAGNEELWCIADRGRSVRMQFRLKL